MRCGGEARNGQTAGLDPGSRGAVRPTPQPGTRRWLDDTRRARPNRADALLFLRPAVRHPAQGEGREDHRLRALGGLPL